MLKLTAKNINTYKKIPEERSDPKEACVKDSPPLQSLFLWDFFAIGIVLSPNLLYNHLIPKKGDFFHFKNFITQKGDVLLL